MSTSPSQKILSRLYKGLKALLGFPFYVYKSYQLQKRMGTKLNDIVLHDLVEIKNLQAMMLGSLNEISNHLVPLRTVTLPAILKPVPSQGLIRLGREGDGGYVIPLDTVKATEVLISFGINNDYSFEKDFSEISQAKVHAYDKSTEDFLSNVDFAKEFFRFFDGIQSHFYPKFIACGDLNDILAKHQDKNVFLQFDIELAEYDIWDELMKLPSNVIGVACELHDFRNKYQDIIDWVTKSEFCLVHMHINNAGIYYNEQFESVANLIEITLVRSEYFSRKQDSIEYPIPGLDFPNLPEKRDCRIIFR